MTPSLKVNESLKFAQDVALNLVKERGKLRYKLSYELFNKEDICNPLLLIYLYPNLIQLKYFLAGSSIVSQLLASGFLVLILFAFPIT